MMHSEYTIRNLGELMETAQAIHNEAIADNDGGSIDPSEILIDCEGWDNFTLVARSHTLSDKSVVYDVHIPVKQPEHGPAVIDAANDTDMPTPKVVGHINITPRGLETQEGIERCNAATQAFSDHTANVANLATSFLDCYGDFIAEQLSVDEQASEEWAELQAAIASRRAAQEEFLRSLCGAPPAAR